MKHRDKRQTVGWIAVILSTAVTLIANVWPRFGGGLHLLLALLAVGFFNAFSNAAAFLLILPLAGLGMMY